MKSLIPKTIAVILNAMETCEASMSTIENNVINEEFPSNGTQKLINSTTPLQKQFSSKPDTMPLGQRFIIVFRMTIIFCFSLT
ncbi:hypothetical protein DU508_17145 [Pedobacter chinensis]|uniref:Uncharacterized protein n=1 Tax=Pedobacter chinensis TaxID=2282421 RepID=A0A369PXA2_9SPHI|nr:hypothetical protein DU508_17145 [Pedobacter chinensis]